MSPRQGEGRGSGDRPAAPESPRREVSSVGRPQTTDRRGWETTSNQMGSVQTATLPRRDLCRGRLVTAAPSEALTRHASSRHVSLPRPSPDASRAGHHLISPNQIRAGSDRGATAVLPGDTPPLSPPPPRPGTVTEHASRGATESGVFGTTLWSDEPYYSALSIENDILCPHDCDKCWAVVG